MQVKELLERYQQGERNFAHVDLTGASLSGANLRDIDLSGANLTGANLSWAFLNRANLVGACLRRTDLRSATLNAASLSQANLSGANFSKADLRVAQLQGADLNWATGQEADLGGANLEGAKLDQANLERAKLNGTRLVEAELMEAQLRRVSLAGATLDRANLREANLEEANLREASLVGTNLTEANLSGVYLRQANLSEADLHRVMLTGADLSEATLNNADLSRANLTGAYLLKASFKKAYLVRTSLQDVFLLRADLSEANLRGADLRRADLSGAYLSDANLSEADLENAFLLESHLIRTNLEGAKLTGCCIYHWHTEGLDFSKVECRHVFTQFNYHTKCPTDRYPLNRDLEVGELGNLYKIDNAAIELYLTETPDWETLVFTLTQVELETHELKLTIQSYNRVDDNYLLRLTANRQVNPKILIRRVFQLYPQIRQRVLAKRCDLLKLLDIQAHPNPLEASIENGALASAQAGSHRERPDLAGDATVIQAARPASSKDRRAQVYQEVVRQIQHILLSQKPGQFVESVQRLLDYLSFQGISTEEIQQKIIGQAIVQRAKEDPTFREHLLRWEQTTEESIRLSPMGQTVRMAIAIVWP